MTRVPASFDSQAAQSYIRARCVVRPNGCWVWLLALRTGYGQACFRYGYWQAHRLSYAAFRGTRFLLGSLELDHLCRVRSCVNPHHLQLVTHRANTLRGLGPTALNSRKTHCAVGHPFSGSNLLFYRGSRVCRACRHAYNRRYQARPHVRRRLRRYQAAYLARPGARAKRREYMRRYMRAYQLAYRARNRRECLAERGS
jgi:hypothetical protein